MGEHLSLGSSEIGCIFLSFLSFLSFFAVAMEKKTVNTLLPLNEKFPSIPAKLTAARDEVNVSEAKEWGNVYRLIVFCSRYVPFEQNSAVVRLHLGKHRKNNSTGVKQNKLEFYASGRGGGESFDEKMRTLVCVLL